MKNFLYSFLILASCASSETDLLVNDTHAENKDTLVAQEGRFGSERITGNLVEFPSYPVTYTGLDQCLPQPTSAFTEGRISGTLNSNVDGLYLDDLYLYLYHALDTVSEKRFYLTTDSPGGLMWGQEFEQGIFYCYEELESGGGIELWTRCKDEAAFFEVIDQVLNYEPFESIEDYGWDEEHREFSPLDGGAGCYYSITTDSLGYFHLTSYCGC
ncbi:MAG: hypothetical protein IT222_05920 [Crocinitomix sp.]|nr:hypothetical protein [Crocinitomix sp.]